MTSNSSSDDAFSRVLGIEDRVIVTEPLYDRQKTGAYVDADVYVLPCQYENFGTTVLEAAACGTPVLASPVRAIPDIVANGETVFVLANNSPMCIANSISNILKIGKA